MSAPAVITLDFETHAIEPRPNFPPKPVGLAIRTTVGEGRYQAFAHETGANTHSYEQTKQTLQSIWESDMPVLFHNAKFDLAVAYEVYGLPELPWERVHDTMLLSFLADPHCRDMGLKSLAEEWLGWPPEELDKMGDWLWEKRFDLKAEFGLKITRGKNGVAKAAKYTAYVPGDIAGEYAVGDVDRTLALFNHLYPLIAENGMLAAYDRERRLMPILMENERIGMRVDLSRLEEDVVGYQGEMQKAETWLRKRLNDPFLNLDADRDVAEAFRREQIVADEDWVMTKSGQLSISKENLTPEKYQDQQVASVFGYRNRLQTAMNMFMLPWLEQGSQRNGFISTNWNQTRGGGGGTRTGRPSTSAPNFLNISKSFTDRGDGYSHPEFADLYPLPLVRQYILPDDDESLFLHRDFSGQELRVFAHFEDGEAASAFRADPDFDLHAAVQAKILEVANSDEARAKFQNRTNVKIMNFQSIYGGGLDATAKGLRCSRAEAKEFKAMHNAALPGRKALDDEIRRIVATGEPICTWGGRLYFTEEPRMIGGRKRTFEYKLLNYLVQGSAADITKEVLIRWHNHPKRDARFLVTVYDEINISAREDVATEQMLLLKDVMEDIPDFDVPMRSDGKYGINWGALEKCE